MYVCMYVKTKAMHPKSDFQLWQPAHFPTKNSINKPAMNQRRLLIADVFHFKHPVEKYSKIHHKLTKYAAKIRPDLFSKNSIVF